MTQLADAIILLHPQKRLHFGARVEAVAGLRICKALGSAGTSAASNNARNASMPLATI